MFDAVKSSLRCFTKSVAKMPERCSSDSEEDVYTSSIDIRKVRCTPVVVNALPPDGNSSRLGKPEIVALSDDDSDSLDLSEPENNCPKKAKRLRTKRLERMERDQMRELDKIMSEEVRAPKRTNYVAHSSYLDSFNDSLELVERADENTAPKPSASTPKRSLSIEKLICLSLLARAMRRESQVVS